MTEQLPDYRIIRSGRKTLALQISPQGEVLVRAPQRLSELRIREFVAANTEWIYAKLARFQAAQSAAPALPRLTPGQLAELKKRARTELEARVRRFAPQLGVTWGRIAIRTQHTLWGSCSAKGNLNFNALLALTPPEVQDYVVIHELCHRKHMDHSPQFWAEVERLAPDWKARRDWLKRNGSGLMARLPEKSRPPA